MTEYDRLRVVDPSLIHRVGEPTRDAAEIFATAKSADIVIGSLKEGGTDRDICLAAACMLAGRERVWLACLWSKFGQLLGLKDPGRALKAAEQWVQNPEEVVRYKAQELAMAEDCAYPGSWAGMAAFFSGASISLPDLEPVAPEPFLAPVAAFTVVGLLHCPDRSSEEITADAARLALAVARRQTGLDIINELAATYKIDRQEDTKHGDGTLN